DALPIFPESTVPVSSQSATLRSAPSCAPAPASKSRSATSEGRRKDNRRRCFRVFAISPIVAGAGTGGALFLRGRLQPEPLHHLLEVRPRLPLLVRAAKQVGGMEGGQEIDPLVAVPVPTEPADRLRGPEQRLGGELPQRDDHLGADRPDLAREEGGAGLDLVRLGIAVPRRPALDHV